jgi:hypothetical protein
VEDAAFSRLSLLCSSAVVSNKSGNATGSLVFDGTTVTRSVSGVINFTMTATDSLCVANCSNLPSLVAPYGLTGSCSGSANACTCSWSMRFGGTGTNTYTTSNGVITLTSGPARTFAYCVNGTTMQYTETTSSAGEPGLYGLVKQ